MKDINLLPKKERISDARIILLNFVIILFVIIVIIMVLAILLVNDIGRDLDSRLDRYKDTNMELNEYVVELETYKDFEDMIIEKESNIEMLNIENIRWSYLLYDIAQAKPDGLYVTNVIGSSNTLYEYINNLILGEEVESDKNMAFSLQGYARDQFEVSKYVLALKDIPEINEVWINTINATVIPGLEIEAYFYMIEAFWDISEYEELKPEQTTDTENVFDENLNMEEIQIEQ
jgi:hypothetical protein